MYQKYYLPCAKVFGFVSCIVKSNIIVIGATKHSWGYVRTIKYGKISAIISEISDKQNIVYSSACIEFSLIEHNQSD